MGAGEGGEDEVAAVGAALGDGHLVAVLDRAAHLVEVGEVDLRVDALAEEIQPQGHEVDVAGALAVAEQAALDAVGAGEVAELRGGDAGAAVVVRVQGQHDGVAAVEVAVHPLDRVGVDVGGGHLHGRRQVDDHLVLRGGLDDVDDGIADAQGVLELGAGVGLRGVLVGDVRVRDRLLVLLAQQRALHGDVEHGVLVGAEDDVALHDRGGVVEVDDGALGARDRLVGALDEVLAGLGEDLDGDVLGDAVLLDESAHEVVIRLRRRREADLDLLVPHVHQELEHAQLALGVHGVDERLVAVTQVDRAPAGGARDPAGGPGAVGELDLDLLMEGQVLVDRHARGLLGGVS